MGEKPANADYGLVPLAQLTSMTKVTPRNSKAPISSRTKVELFRLAEFGVAAKTGSQVLPLDSS